MWENSNRRRSTASLFFLQREEKSLFQGMFLTSKSLFRVIAEIGNQAYNIRVLHILVNSKRNSPNSMDSKNIDGPDPAENGKPEKLAPSASEFKTAVTMVNETAVTAAPPLETAATMAEAPQSAGRIFADGEKIGKYIIDKRLGKGGMGEVYLATHETLGIQRAIKVLPKEIAEKNSQFLARFLREAKTACEIRHSNIVNVMDVETDEARGLSYIVMEFVDGGDVRGLLKASGHLTIDQSVVIVEAVASALAAASEFGIVHRDIKPDNIMLTRRGDVKLADLGIAKSAEEDIQLTKTNVMMGTPAYLSPEQARDAKHVDVRADIYSLGATFFEMLTGRIPYPGESTFDILSKLFSDPVPNPCDYNPDVPPEIGKIVVTMLAKDPAKRYRSAEELLEVLVNCRAQRRTVVESQKLIREAIATAFGAEACSCTTVGIGRRRRRKNWKIAAAVILVPAIAGMLAWHFSRPGKTAAGSSPASRESALPARAFRAEFRVMPASASVSIRNRSGQEIPAAARSGGLFLFELPAGFYLYTVSGDGFRSVAGTMELHSDAAPKEIALLPAIFTVQSEPKAAIELIRNGKRAGGGIADDNGNFSIGALPAGRYVVVASLDGRVSRREEIELAGNTDMKHPFRLGPAAAAGVKYRLNFKTTPADARISLRNGSGKELGAASKIGSVCSYELPSGFYLYSVARSGYAPCEGKIDLKQNTDIPDIALAPYAVSVTVLPGTKVELRQDSETVASGIADKQGNCVFQAIPGGKYALRGELDGYAARREEVEVASDSDTKLAMKLAVEEWEVHFSATPGSAAVLSRNGKRMAETVLRERDSVIKLPRGEYRAELSLKDHSAKTVGFTVPDELRVGARLEKNVFALRVDVTPDKVRAELGREDGGMPARIVHLDGNCTFSGLSSGNYILTLSCDGYENYREAFTVSGDETKNIVMKKIPQVGADNGGIILRQVKSNSPELEKYIVLNGVEIKLKNRDSAWRRVKFPFTITDLPAGEYTVIFRVPEKNVKGQESEPVRVEKGKYSDYTMIMVTF